MTTPIKRHRRNYAVEQEEEGYRLSVPLFQNSPIK